MLNKKHLKESNLIDKTEIWTQLDDQGFTLVDPETFDENPQLVKLSLAYNKLNSLDPRSLSKLRNLTHLFLDSNKLTSLNQNIFNGLVKLQQIYLSSNHLTEIHPMTFSGLVNLKKLYLGYNQLSVLHQDTFNGLVKLQQLYLSSNLLTSIHPKTFNDLVNLEKLNLANNQLETLDKDLFRNLKELQEIFLGWNQLSSIDSNLFKGLKKLEEIHLENNRLSENNLKLYLEESVHFISIKKDNKENNIDSVIQLKEVSKEFLKTPSNMRRKRSHDDHFKYLPRVNSDQAMYEVYNNVYQSKKILGHGAFGYVILVEHIRTQEKYALKLTNQVFNPKKFQETDESKLLKKLSSPYLIEYHDHFFEFIPQLDGNRFGLVIEYCKEGDLLRVINKLKDEEKTINEKLLFEYIRDILKGLDFLHLNGIVHRDVKPCNIFLKNGRVKLGDLSLAKDTELLQKSITFGGTLDYCSPEMCEKYIEGDAIKVNEKTDIWSCGCVLYELKSLEKAFKLGSNGIRNFIYRIKNDQPNIPGYFSVLLKKMFQPDPDKRSSALNLLKEMHEIIEPLVQAN